MIIGKVTGSVVSTRKNENLIGNKFMIVEPAKEMGMSGSIVAIDNVGIRRSSKDSQILHILGPQKPEVIIAEDGKDYTSIILTDEANGMTLTVKPGLDDKFYVDDYDEDSKTQLSFEWKKNNGLNDTSKIDIDNAYD